MKRKSIGVLVLFLFAVQTLFAIDAFAGAAVFYEQGQPSIGTANAGIVYPKKYGAKACYIVKDKTVMKIISYLLKRESVK